MCDMAETQIKQQGLLGFKDQIVEALRGAGFKLRQSPNDFNAYRVTCGNNQNFWLVVFIPQPVEEWQVLPQADHAEWVQIRAIVDRVIS
jgi:hypothetical protein